jgi:hypothetical protein
MVIRLNKGSNSIKIDYLIYFHILNDEDDNCRKNKRNIQEFRFDQRE